MITEPNLEDRKEQHYVAVRSQNTMNELDTAIPQGIGEVAAWIGKQGGAPAGATFIRYLAVDMEALIQIAKGFLCARFRPGDGRVRAGVRPAGRHASLINS